MRYMCKDDIFELDVSVYNALPVQKIHTLKHLPDQNRRGLLAKFAHLPQKLEKVSVASEFQQQVDVLLIAEAVVQLDEVGVLEKGLDFDLAADLVDRFESLLRAACQQLAFADDLECCDEAGFVVAGLDRCT